MRGAYPYGKLSWFPDLSQVEARIWERFIEQFPNMYDSVDYCFHVGTIPTHVLAHPEQNMRQESPLYQYEIDVVGYKGDEVDIIELKHWATMRALGQVNGYAQLYQRDIDPASNPKRVLVTDRLMPDMEHLAFAAGVQLVIV